MLFKTTKQLSSNMEKKYFKEKIDIYIRLIEVYKEKFSIIDNPSNQINIMEQLDITEELINIGVIENFEEVKELEEFLGKDTYSKFIDSVYFYVKNKESMGALLDKLNNSKRKELQQIEQESDKYKLVDFFCGAGGFSLGFIQAGFSVKLANDIDELCIETYKYNHPEVSSDKIIQGDIRKIVEHIEKYIDDDIDVVIGGPPCQGFSSANQNRIIDDPRNELYKYYIKAIEKIAPKFVVMENVKGMLKVADQVVEDYKKLKVNKNGYQYTYDVAYRLLNSQHFSVAQSRERLIYIIVRNDIQAKYSIKPESLFEEIAINNEGKPIYNLAEALDFIKPLEAPSKKNMGEIDTEEHGKKIDVNEYMGNENEYLKLINMNRKIPIIYNHKARYCNEVNYEIYKRLDQGDDATDSKIEDIMPYSHRNDKFKDKYYKLIADKPCRTITAHLRSDGHSHIHPYQTRTLTPREAARVQSFPDDYLFLGPYLKTYIQIGNAVPVVMARQIAEVLKKYLE